MENGVVGGMDMTYDGCLHAYQSQLRADAHC